VQLGLRVTPADAARIKALAERFPIATEASIARAALLIGLDAIEAQPAILLGERPTKRK
jgi:hypothetical protein